MKRAILQPLLVILFLAFLALTIYAVPVTLHYLSDVSYKFVLLFLVLIFASNVLARIAKTFINL